MKYLLSIIGSLFALALGTWWLYSEPAPEPVAFVFASIFAFSSTCYLYGKKENNGYQQELFASPLTPDSPILSHLMRGAIQMVCRGVSVPQTPESADLRAFIFEKKEEHLICTHFWSPNPVKEEVGNTKFRISRENAEKIAIVQSYLDKQTCRAEVSPLPKEILDDSGEIDPDLKFVLAAPILNEDGSVWGVVDFDTGNEIGKALLETQVSDTVMFMLAKHLRLIFSLTEHDKTSHTSP